MIDDVLTSAVADYEGVEDLHPLHAVDWLFWFRFKRLKHAQQIH